MAEENNSVKKPEYQSLFNKNTQHSDLSELAAENARAIMMEAEDRQHAEEEIVNFRIKSENEISKMQLGMIEAAKEAQRQQLNQYFKEYEVHIKTQIENEKRQKEAQLRDELTKRSDLTKAQQEAELQTRLQNANKELDAKQKKELDQLAKLQKASTGATDKNSGEKKQNKEVKKAVQERKHELLSTLKNKDATAEEKQEAQNELASSHSKLGSAGIALDAIQDNMKTWQKSQLKKLDSLVTGLQSTIDQQASLKSSIDTRLQGFDGKHWDDMSKDLIAIAGTSPLIKQADLQEKIKSMVTQGIAFNVEQRATLGVMADKIAGTFDVTNDSLTKLVRIQQQDTTAARLGMESALTSFLNSMYETSEFMQSVAQTVRDQLYEAEALMTSTNATSFEYQVEKWLGSLYSVGMSSDRIQSIASVLGQLAAGQLDSISGNNSTGTLLVMSANRAGLSIADILNNGLTDDETNELMQAMVNYLAEIADQAGDSKVIQQQLASVYGLSASDLKAVSNLATSTSTVVQSSLDYSDALQQLNYMASTMSDRVSLGEKLSNITDNLKQTLARSVSSNPALYATYTMGSLLRDYAGTGSDFSIPLILGSGSTQQFSIADLMQYGAVGVGLLSNVGNIISAVGNSLQGGTGILNAIGVNSGISTVSRGTGGLVTASGTSISSSGSYVANSSSSDLTNKIMTDTTDSTNNTVSAAADESTETTNTTIDEHIVQIYDLLYQVVDGTNLRVSIEADNRFTF